MRIAIITGASAGMGREFVTQLADHFGGIREIWVVARRKGRLSELSGQIPAHIRCFPVDLTDQEGIKELRRALEKEKPDVKILVNAAGYGKIGSVGSVDMEMETGMVRLNCEAVCAVTHLVLPYMSKNSRIIQFASSAAFVPQPGFAIYAATKAFILSYSRALNEELRPRGIRVTAVCPGPVRTEFFDIAETTGKIPLYKRISMADPKRVVQKALRDSMMGKAVSVYGFLMNAFRLLCKVLPHKLILDIMNRMNQNTKG